MPLPGLKDYGTSKRCTRCGERKPVDEFYVLNKRWRQSRCKDCLFQITIADRKAHRPRWAAYRQKHHMKQRYGVSAVEYERLLKEQNGVCAICKGTNPSKRRLSLDHEHKTGKHRGLLCDNCNNGIGRFHEEVGRLAAAIAYLEHHRGMESNS